MKGVIHKVCTLGGGRGGPAKSVLARMRGRRFSCRRTYVIFFSQVRYKIEIKKGSYLDSHNYPFPSPLYSQKEQTPSQGFSSCFDLTFSDSFVW